MSKIPMVRLGQAIKFDGRNWVVASIDLQNDSFTLTNAINIYSTERREVTAEQLFGEHVMKIKQEVEKTVDAMFGFGGQAVDMSDQMEAMRKWMVEQGRDDAVRYRPGGYSTFNFDVGPNSGSVIPAYSYNASNDPGCDGWHVIWESTTDIPDDGYRAFIGDVTPVRMPMPCESLEDCWVAVDYINDDELGNPVSIKCGARVHYMKWDSKWRQMRAEDPPVPEAYLE